MHVESKRNSSRKSLYLWEFLYGLLEDEECKHVIEWTNKEERLFSINDTEELAKLWGTVKNRPKMDQFKLFRAMRTYYDRGLLKKVCLTMNELQIQVCISSSVYLSVWAYKCVNFLCCHGVFDEGWYKVKSYWSKFPRILTFRTTIVSVRFIHAGLIAHLTLSWIYQFQECHHQRVSRQIVWSHQCAYEWCLREIHV